MSAVLSEPEQSPDAFTYSPPRTIAALMQDQSFGRFIIGPFGSGKTTGMIMELCRRMREQAPNRRGIRPTRFAVVRNTLQQLRSTVLPDIQQFLGPLFKYKYNDNALNFFVPLEDGTVIQSEWILIPLDQPEDVRRLLSLQLTGAWIAEFREVPLSVIAGLEGRVGRYPSKANVEPTWYGLIGESNPFAEGSEWFEKLIVNLPGDWRLFRQPSGRSPEAENIENLPHGYYERLAANNPESWVSVHVDGNLGDDLAGQAVFRSSFVPSSHVTYEHLNVNPHRPIMVALDFGRTPTALITQTDGTGRLIIFEELTSEDMGIHRFVDEILKPKLLTERYAGRLVFVVADPAGAHKTQAREESLFDVVQSHGLMIYAAVTNDIAKRIAAVESVMLQTRNHKPALLISGEECPLLVKALSAHYRYPRRRNGTLQDKPDKNHPWSDLADCLQYAALGMNSYVARKALARLERNTGPRQPPPRAAAWT